MKRFEILGRDIMLKQRREAQFREKLFEITMNKAMRYV